MHIFSVGAKLLHLLIPTVLFLFFSCNACAGTGSDDAPASASQSCLPGEGPCFMATDEPGSTLYRSLWTESDNPAEDGWDTEVFNGAAGKQLKKLGKLLLDPEKIDAEHVKVLASEEFITQGLGGFAVDTVFAGDNLGVRRQPSGTLLPAENDWKYRGMDGLAKALKELAEPFLGADDLRFKFKIFRVQKKNGFIITRQYFSISGITDRGVLEQNASWDIRWIEGGGSAPRIAAVAVAEFEEVRGKKNRGKLYRDVTESVLYNNESYGNQILRGYPEFLSSIENSLEFNIFGTPGLAVGDVNNDGLDDLYICQEQGLPNLLYLQNENGTATDVSGYSGTNWLESSRSALFLDLDNDGDQDLLVAMPGAVVVAVNNSKGKFVVTNSLAIDDDPMTMAAADYDNDGDTDIYVTLYNPNRPIEKSTSSARNSSSPSFVYHDANNGPGNVLFRNDLEDGELGFTDVTENSGIDVNNSRFSLSAAWEDYDNDGDQDLYVANDYGRDNLYRNDTEKGGKPRFTDISDQARVEDSAGSMGIAWGDYNRDGNMDGFVSAMWSSAGNRVTFQESFKPDSPTVKKRLQRFAHGNTMLENNGDTTFSDVSEATGIEMGRWAWSSNFVDINNDGWEDLVVANGFLTGDSEGGDL